MEQRKELILCLRAVLIHRGLKLRHLYLSLQNRFREVLINRGLKPFVTKNIKKFFLRAVLIHRGLKLGFQMLCGC